MKITVLKLHRYLAIPLLLPLFLASTTGIAYRLGRSWFGLGDSFGNWMMTIHEGRFLGQSWVPFYVASVGLGSLMLVASGAALWYRLRRGRSAKLPLDRKMHRLVAPFILLPLVISASTGVAYRLSTTWLGFSGREVRFLLFLHQGSYLGPALRPFYVLLLGAGLLMLLVTGAQMLRPARARKKLQQLEKSLKFGQSLGRSS